MLKVIFYFAVFFSFTALATTEAELDRCVQISSGVQADLCMNKVLLRAIKGQTGGGNGGSGIIGKIVFHRDDGSCTNPIGQVLMTLDATTNSTICQNAVSSRDVWGVSIENGGTALCVNISDSDATSACRNGMRRAGAPIN